MKRRFFSWEMSENRVIAYMAVAAGFITFINLTIGLP